LSHFRRQAGVAAELIVKAEEQLAEISEKRAAADAKLKSEVRTTRHQCHDSKVLPGIRGRGWQADACATQQCHYDRNEFPAIR
jgi:hypothetical protein